MMDGFSQSSIEMTLYSNDRILKTSVLSFFFFFTMTPAKTTGLNISKNLFNRLVTDRINEVCLLTVELTATVLFWSSFDSLRSLFWRQHKTMNFCLLFLLRNNFYS